MIILFYSFISSVSICKYIDNNWEWDGLNSNHLETNGDNCELNKMLAKQIEYFLLKWCRYGDK